MVKVFGRNGILDPNVKRIFVMRLNFIFCGLRFPGSFGQRGLRMLDAFLQKIRREVTKLWNILFEATGGRTRRTYIFPRSFQEYEITGWAES